MTDSYRVFISYARLDGKNLAERLYHAFKAIGWQPWMDFELKPQNVFSAEIQQELLHCDFVVVIVSNDVNRLNPPSFVQKEINFVQQSKVNKPIFVVRTEDAIIPMLISGLTYADFFDESGYLLANEQFLKCFHRFIEKIQQSLATLENKKALNSILDRKQLLQKKDSDIEIIRSKWADVIIKAQQKSPTISVLLSWLYPVDLQGNDLYLNLEKCELKEKVLNQRYFPQILEIINDVYKQDFNIIVECGLSLIIFKEYWTDIVACTKSKRPTLPALLDWCDLKEITNETLVLFCRNSLLVPRLEDERNCLPLIQCIKDVTGLQITIRVEG